VDTWRSHTHFKGLWYSQNNFFKPLISLMVLGHHSTDRPTTVAYHRGSPHNHPTSLTMWPPRHDDVIAWKKSPKFQSSLNFPKFSKCINLKFLPWLSWKLYNWLLMANFSPVHVNSTTTPEIWHSCVDFSMNSTVEIRDFAQLRPISPRLLYKF